MDHLTCSLSQIVHLCNEASIFLYQLSKFECELEKFYSSTKQTQSIAEHFALILEDFNVYYERCFVKLYLESFNYLSRRCFTVNYSDEILMDFLEDLKYLNQFLKHRKQSYQHIFSYLHQLSITCWICLQYRQLCTNSQLAERFVYIRMDLLNNLERLHEEIRILLMRINSNFTHRKQSTKNLSRTSIDTTHLLQTILLWFVVFLLTCYFSWPSFPEIESTTSWSVW